MFENFEVSPDRDLVFVAKFPEIDFLTKIKYVFKTTIVGKFGKINLANEYVQKF